MEGRNPVVVASDSFAIDDAGSAIETHSGAVLASDDPEAVMFDLVQPFGRRTVLEGTAR